MSLHLSAVPHKKLVGPVVHYVTVWYSLLDCGTVRGTEADSGVHLGASAAHCRGFWRTANSAVLLCCLRQCTTFCPHPPALVSAAVIAWISCSLIGIGLSEADERERLLLICCCVLSKLPKCTAAFLAA